MGIVRSQLVIAFCGTCRSVVQSQLTEAGANCSFNWEAAHSACSLDVGTIDAALSLCLPLSLSTLICIAHN